MSVEPADSASEIACQQVLLADASVFSVQEMTVPARYAVAVDPDYLLARYLEYIRVFTLSLIRPRLTADGLEFRLLGSSLGLIRFTAPQRTGGAGKSVLELAICGGVLVQPAQCARGKLSFAVERTSEGSRLRLRLADYCPLLLGGSRPSRVRKWLYRFTQAYLHRVVTVRFLQRLFRELTGGRRCVRVVRLHLPEGEDI